MVACASPLLRVLVLAALLSTATTYRSAGGAQTADLRLTYEEPKELSGRIFARDSNENKLLFFFKRRATRSGNTLNVEREYQYPDGKPAAREQVIYQGNNLALYRLAELQIGATGSAKIRHDQEHPTKAAIDFEYTVKGGKPKARTESLRDDTLIDDMVGPFLMAHWEQLQRGEKVKCRYIVVPRLETVGFVFRKDSESLWHNRKVVIVKMQPSSRIIAALVEPLFFTIESTPPHRVLQYIGRTTPKIEAGGKWRDLDATTLFDWKP